MKLQDWCRGVMIAGVLVVLAGCGGGGGAAPTTKMQALITGALAVAQKSYPKAELLEARGLPESGTNGKALVDVKSWEFVFDPNNGEPGAVFVTWQNNAYGDATFDADSLYGDANLRKAPRLDFDEAVARLQPAGYPTAFSSATYRQPMDLVNDQPSYIFHITAIRSFVFVGAMNGRIIVQSDHDNMINLLIDNTLEFTRSKFPLAQCYTISADVHWSEDMPSVDFWHIEFNNPATSPATTLVMDYRLGDDLPDPTVEQRTLSGYKPMTGILDLDPTDAIIKLNEAGYNDQFGTIGVRWTTAGSEPVYRFTFGSQKMAVLVGGKTGKVVRE